MTVVRLDGAMRRYDWGSRTAIPELLGVEPDGRPVAELWFGAHPDDPSTAPDHGATLDAIIAEDPVRALGPAVIERFGERLPFLLKVLAADQALSIQVHPTLEQAQAGFAAEDAAGVPRDAPDRNYRDANHKPELIYALTPFKALCGFRPVAETQALLAELELPELDFLVAALAGPDPLRAAFTAVLEHDEPATLVAAFAASIEQLGRHSELAHVVGLVSADYPGDVGVVLSVLLNHVRLEPGEAIYLGAGTVHAYLRGTGIEIMANSDNVLRCGLTAKHIDVGELLRITDFTELAEPRWPATNGVFAVPVPDFRLLPFSVSTVDSPVTLGNDEPWVVLCTAGTVAVGGAVLTAGRAAFVPAADEAVPVEGKGTVFAAAAGVTVPVADA